MEERKEAINRCNKYKQDYLGLQLNFQQLFSSLNLFWEFSEYFLVERKIWHFFIIIRSEIPY